MNYKNLIKECIEASRGEETVDYIINQWLHHEVNYHQTIKDVRGLNCGGLKMGDGYPVVWINLIKRYTDLDHKEAVTEQFETLNKTLTQDFKDLNETLKIFCFYGNSSNSELVDEFALNRDAVVEHFDSPEKFKELLLQDLEKIDQCLSQYSVQVFNFKKNETPLKTVVAL